MWNIQWLIKERLLVLKSGFKDRRSDRVQPILMTPTMIRICRGHSSVWKHTSRKNEIIVDEPGLPELYVLVYQFPLFVCGKVVSKFYRYAAVQGALDKNITIKITLVKTICVGRACRGICHPWQLLSPGPIVAHIHLLWISLPTPAWKIQKSCQDQKSWDKDGPRLSGPRGLRAVKVLKSGPNSFINILAK